MIIQISSPTWILLNKPFKLQMLWLVQELLRNVRTAKHREARKRWRTRRLSRRCGSALCRFPSNKSRATYHRTFHRTFHLTFLAFLLEGAKTGQTDAGTETRRTINNQMYIEIVLYHLWGLHTSRLNNQIERKNIASRMNESGVFAAQDARALMLIVFCSWKLFADVNTVVYSFLHESEIVWPFRTGASVRDLQE